MIRTYELTALTAAGSSVSNDVIAGELLGAYVSYEGAGTMTLTTQHAPVVTFLTMATGGTQWYYPRGTACTTGVAAISYASGYPLETVIPFVDNVAMTTNSTGTASATLVVRV